MSLLENLIYGFVLGFTELLPVSSQAHQTLLQRFFGMGEQLHIQGLLTHVGALLGLLFGCRALLIRLGREKRVSKRLKRSNDQRRTYDLRLVKTAAVPMIIIYVLLHVFGAPLDGNLLFLCLFSVLNGVALIIPVYMRHGNKDARSMTALDSILAGIAASLSVFPGFSRNGTVLAFCSARGADMQHALNWSFLLSIPALVIMIGLDIVVLVTTGVSGITFLMIVETLVSALASFFGAYVGIMLMRFIVVRSDLSAFAYYSWGVALFAFIVYLIV